MNGEDFFDGVMFQLGNETYRYEVVEFVEHLETYEQYLFRVERLSARSNNNSFTR